MTERDGEISFLVAQHISNFAVAANQVRPMLPSTLGKQPEAPQQIQPAAKRAKKEKDNIEDENDILKVRADPKLSLS